MNKANKKVERLRALNKQTDKTLRYFIDEACRILGSPLILYDIDFKVLACAETAGYGTSFWKRFVRDGAIKQEIKDAYVSEGLSDMIVSAQTPIVLHDVKLRYSWIFGRIYDKNDMPIACVHALSTDDAFLDEDLAAVDALCKLLSNEIVKIPYYQSYSQKKIDDCVTMLIDGKAEGAKEKRYIAGYVEMIYRGFKDNLYLAVADISQRDPSYSKLTYYRDLFKQLRPAFKYAIYSNHIVIIMSTDETSFYPKRWFNRLGGLFEQDHIKVGISGRFENLFELSRYYDQAVKALNDGWKAEGSQYLFVYDDGGGLPD